LEIKQAEGRVGGKFQRLISCEWEVESGRKNHWKGERANESMVSMVLTYRANPPRHTAHSASLLAVPADRAPSTASIIQSGTQNTTSPTYSTQSTTSSSSSAQRITSSAYSTGRTSFTVSSTWSRASSTYSIQRITSGTCGTRRTPLTTFQHIEHDGLPAQSTISSTSSTRRGMALGDSEVG